MGTMQAFVRGSSSRAGPADVDSVLCRPPGSFCADGVVTNGDDDSCLVLPEWAIRCGPRKTIYHDPQQARLSSSLVRAQNATQPVVA
jgi:hypothetical protein